MAQTQILEPLHPHGRPSWSSSFLVLAWPSPIWGVTQWKEDITPSHLYLFSCHFAFQVKKIKSLNNNNKKPRLPAWGLHPDLLFSECKNFPAHQSSGGLSVSSPT